ncbi:MAG: hypothetical protein Q9227_003261 [Pyrenula ochraceoflavens]
MLSPRTVHFSTPIFWECRELLANEVDTQGSFSRQEPSKLWPGSSKLDEDAWFKTVMAYSSTSLTKETDKLIAFAGLAEIFGATFRSEYFAGTWMCHLSRALAWYVLGPSFRPAEYRAPSWSWVSMDGRVRFDEGSLEGSKLRDLVRIPDPKDVQRQYEHPCGQTSYEHLDILGTWYRLSQNFDFDVLSGDSHLGRFTHLCFLDTDPLSILKTGRHDLYLLPLRKMRYIGDDMWLYALLLLRKIDEKEVLPIFSRLGFCWQYLPQAGGELQGEMNEPPTPGPLSFSDWARSSWREDNPKLLRLV